MQNTPASTTPKVKLNKAPGKNPNKKSRKWKSLKYSYPLLLMFFPVFVYYLVFRYIPLIGAFIISIKKYQPALGLIGSKWVGFEYFQQFLNSVFFWRLIRNTLAINFFQLLLGFTAPIILALLLNELGSSKFKRLVQSVTYLPNFISSVVVVGIVVVFLSPTTGLVNSVISRLGMEKVNFLTEPSYFWLIYTFMVIWQTTGYNAIIYLASLTGISPELYEASNIDGAGRWKQLWHITLPGISPTIVILLLIRLGNLLEVGYESIILLYNPSVYSTADVISTYVYRRGILNGDYSFASAVGFFQSVIALILIIAANKLAKKYTDTSLW
ncbi:putative aldouronate transport system permease protein [Anaerobacterium chartisolvens]|uniref:Putative aldouronate transport system permease protein n=1 Tax=Anaerobacterium chartisolvens TaxID=1297424 RepID=A0A369B7L2_9FIRM|nr:ABC transporter permease subunit [Anaerobacterium chartisolvens]RCX17519.1 putative aldouronate transport system permease protein [Anaerobacterium chartisolvens]